jgi:hypothetical protein
MVAVSQTPGGREKLCAAGHTPSRAPKRYSSRPLLALSQLEYRFGEVFREHNAHNLKIVG